MNAWYDDHRNLAVLARHMVEEGDDADGIVYMLLKPWKFEAEWHAAMALDDVALIVGETPPDPGERRHRANRRRNR